MLYLVTFAFLKTKIWKIKKKLFGVSFDLEGTPMCVKPSVVFVLPNQVYNDHSNQ